MFAAMLAATVLIADRPLLAQVQASSAQRVQLEGELEILSKDFKDHAKISYSLKLRDGSHVPLQFLKHPPTHLLTGDHVSASGEISNGNLVLYSGTNLTATTDYGAASASTSSPVANTIGPQSVLVMLVNFQDDAVQPNTVADVQNTVFSQVNNYFVENSYGQTSLNGTVIGWHTIPVSVTTCDTTQIATYAKNAATASGVNLANYTRYVYFFPTDNACGFAGTSTVGGNPSESWINGNLQDVHTISHELGHAFGLWHSHTLDCGTSATICSNGNVIEYGDLLDAMGFQQTASPDFNAYQKERLGWLNYAASPSIQTVQTSGTYTINPYELGGSGPNALKILKSTDPTTGAKTWYYLEARQAIGFDSFLTSGGTYYTQNETNGVLFHTGSDGDANTSDALDMTPATPTNNNYWDASLVVGKSFQDSTAGVTFTPISVGSNGASIQIQFGGSTSSPTSISVSTNQSTYSAGQNVASSVTAFAGTTPAAGISVKVTITPPGGKSTVLNGITGSNGVAVLNYKLPKRATTGTYQVQATTVSSGNAPTSVASTSFKVQ